MNRNNIENSMEPQIKTVIGIPNELCRRAGISGTWLHVNQIGIFPNQPIKHFKQDKPSDFVTDRPISMFHVRQEVFLYHQKLRVLVNEASDVFINVQTLVHSKPVNLKKELLQYSTQYRSIIRACLELLRVEEMRTEGHDKVELQNFITIFYSIECIWHICEILYIENIPGYFVIKYLLEWIRFHFPKYERKAAILLTGETAALESHPDYWKTIIGCLLQGRVEIVRALLAMHSMAHTNPFKLAEQTLKSMPIYDILEGISVMEFNLRWKHWLVDTQSKIEAKMFLSESNLNFMMRLIIGEEDAWNKAQEQCETWYELMAGWLFYTEPTVKSFELSKFAKRCMTRMGVPMHHLDRLLLAAMEADIEVIKEIQHMKDNGWFATHLTDLLFHCGQLEKWQENNISAVKLRESFLIDYGSLLMDHQSLWQIGLNYLDYCPTEGVAIISLLLPRISVNNEAKANKVIREAQKRELPHIVHSVSKIQGMDSMRKGRFGNALVWALKSRDTNFISFLADCFLKDYIKSSVLPNQDLLNHLGSCMMACDRLIFLGKYYQFQKLYAEQNFKEASSTLISLIASKFTPKYFWPILLMDALPLLECDELVLSSNDTFILLNCIEERTELKDMQERIELIRLGIARNLSRALTFEAQYSKMR